MKIETDRITHNGNSDHATPLHLETHRNSPVETKTEQKLEERKRFKPLIIAILIGSGVIGLTMAGYHWWNVGRFIQSTDDAYVGGDVTVIAPKVAGFISRLNVGDNQSVHAGDILLKLDDRDYVAALAKTEAGVAFQKAALTNLEANRLLQESIVAEAQANVAATDAETVRARDDEHRMLNLQHTGAISAQGFEKSDAEYKEAVALGEKARAAVTEAQRHLAVIDTEKQQVEASLAGALAERDLARLNLSYTELRAPMDGTVGNRSARLGAYATIGSQLISLAPARGLWVDANFKESQLELIHPGDPAMVKVDSMPGRIFHGRVASISPATGAQFSILPPENATGNFTKIVQRVPVRIELDDEDATLGRLRVGLSVEASVDTQKSVKPTERASL